MSKAWIILKKDLKDTLRDRRTLLMMIIVPLVFVPVSIGLLAQLKAGPGGEMPPPLHVGLAGQPPASFTRLVRAQRDVIVLHDVARDSARTLIRRGEIDAVFFFRPGFDERRASEEEVMLFLPADGPALGERRRVRTLVEAYRADLLAERLEHLGLDESAHPLRINEIDVSTQDEVLGEVMSGFLPYMFLLFCYLGAMYPAIDLAAGEKERATLETLLTSPATPFQIALGKFGVVVVTGLGSALIAILGAYLGLLLFDDVPRAFASAIQRIMRPRALLLEMSFLLPLTMLFAGVMLTLSVFARSFKEAQSIISPLAIVAILPAAFGLFPGVALTPMTALIPVLNVTLATKAVIAGSLPLFPLFLVYASLTSLAWLSLYVCAQHFKRESVLFRA